MPHQTPNSIPPKTNERSVDSPHVASAGPIRRLRAWLRGLPCFADLGRGPAYARMRDIAADLDHGRS